MSVGREQEAKDFLVKYHGNGNPDDELVLFEFEEIKEAIRTEKIAKGTSWKSLLSSRGNQHRLSLAALMSFMTCLSGCEWRAGCAFQTAILSATNTRLQLPSSTTIVSTGFSARVLLQRPDHLDMLQTSSSLSSPVSRVHRPRPVSTPV